MRESTKLLLQRRMCYIQLEGHSKGRFKGHAIWSLVHNHKTLRTTQNLSDVVEIDM